MTSPNAKYNWWLAGWCKAYFYSGAFVARQIIATKEWKIGLDRAELLDFREYEANEYALEISVARWHTKMNFKVWQYRNDLTDATSVDLQRILTDLNRIEQKVNDISEFGRS